MGQVLACCTGAEREANDDTKLYRPPPQEIEQPWKEKIETNEGKAVLAVDPNFTEDLALLETPPWTYPKQRYIPLKSQKE